MLSNNLMPIRVLIGIVIVIVLLSGCANNATVLDKRSALQALAGQGSADAQYELGRSYCCGRGAGYDKVIAREWFCKAALQGHGGAQYQLGRMMGERMDTHSMPGKRQDLIEAYMWYSLAALQNETLAITERDALELDLKSQEILESAKRMRKWQSLECR